MKGKVRFLYLARNLCTILAVFLIGCGSDSGSGDIDIQNNFTQEVDRSNSCATDNDCVLVYPGCPLGCGVAVNVGAEEKVRNLAAEIIDSHNKNNPACAYSCMALYTVCYIDTCQTKTL